jgi:hypothetical protein
MLRTSLSWALRCAAAIASAEMSIANTLLHCRRQVKSKPTVESEAIQRPALRAPLCAQIILALIEKSPGFLPAHW